MFNMADRRFETLDLGLLSLLGPQLYFSAMASLRCGLTDGRAAVVLANLKGGLGL